MHRLVSFVALSVFLFTVRVQCKPTGPATGKCAQEPARPNKPQCTKSGNYELIQRHPPIGYTYCVNPETGRKIEGTVVYPGATPTCPRCVEFLANDLERPSKFDNPIFNFRFQCDEDGKFSTIQTDEKGFTWCINRDTGASIPSWKLPDSVDKTKCTYEPQGPCKAETNYFIVPVGGYYPACDARGYYEPVQRNNGFRFCVDTETRRELKDSPKLPFDDQTKLPCEI